MKSTRKVSWAYSVGCTVILTSVIGLSGCSSRSDDLRATSDDAIGPFVGPPSPEVEIGDDNRPDTEAISGLWDAGIQTADGLNEIYKLVSSDGIVSDYDYRQDDIGSGENCYDVTSFGLNPEGDNRYSIGNRVFTMIREGNELTVKFVDVDDVDRDEDVSEMLAQTWTLLVGIDPMDLPNCGI